MGKLKTIVLVMVLVATVRICAAAEINPDTLADAITQIVESNSPTIDPNKLAHRSYGIATTAINGATNFTSLEANLLSAFKNTDGLGWATNQDHLAQAAATLASKFNPESTPLTVQANANAGKTVGAGSNVTSNASSPTSGATNNTATLEQSGKNTFPKWRVAFSSGAQFLNPYVITVPHGAGKGSFGTLTNSGNSTVAYLEFDVTRCWVLSPDAMDQIHSGQDNTWVDGFTFLDSSKKDWTPDLKIDLGFLLANNVNSTNKTYTAQTLAGSDIYIDLGLGLPLWRNNWQTNDGVPVQVSLGGSLGVRTDQSIEKVYANEFIGGVVDIGLPYGFFQNTNTTASGLIEAKLGYGHLNYPSLTGTANQVNLDGNGIPVFKEVWSPEIGGYALIPFGSVLFLNLEANAYFSDQTPNQWNVKVGVTVPWSTVQGMLPFIK